MKFLMLFLVLCLPIFAAVVAYKLQPKRKTQLTSDYKWKLKNWNLEYKLDGFIVANKLKAFSNCYY